MVRALVEGHPLMAREERVKLLGPPVEHYLDVVVAGGLPKRREDAQAAGLGAAPGQNGQGVVVGGPGGLPPQVPLHPLHRPAGHRPEDAVDVHRPVVAAVDQELEGLHHGPDVPLLGDGGPIGDQGPGGGGLGADRRGVGHLRGRRRRRIPITGGGEERRRRQRRQSSVPPGRHPRRA